MNFGTASRTKAPPFLPHNPIADRVTRLLTAEKKGQQKLPVTVCERAKSHAPVAAHARFQSTFRYPVLQQLRVLIGMFDWRLSAVAYRESRRNAVISGGSRVRALQK